MKKSLKITLISILASVIVVSLTIIILFFTVFNNPGKRVYDVSHFVQYKFELDEKNYTAKVSKAESLIISGELEIPKQVSKDDVVYDVVEVADDAFSRCEISSIILPSTIKRIGNRAFYNCNTVESDLTLPDALTYIGDSAFEGCTFTGDLKIPVGVTYLGARAFKNCTFDGELTIPTSITEIKEYTFDNCSKMSGRIDVPSNITKIGDYAFYKCENIFTLIMIDGLQDIGKYAFAYCGINGDVNIPSTVTEIKTHTFYNCSKIINVKFSNQLQYIRDYAFYGCKMIEQIFVTHGLQDIGGYAFGGCTALTEIHIDSINVLERLTSKTAQGQLLDTDYRSRIYVAQGINDSVTSFLTDHYRTTSSDEHYPGYVVYVRN